MIKKGHTFTVPFVVDAAAYNGFISLFNDKNPLHTDAEFARSAGFKECVMHGNILNGFLSYFVGECLPIKNVIIHSQEIDYKNPVYLNDKLDLFAEVNEVHESAKAIEFKFIFTSQSGKKVAVGKFQIGII
jgi:3-hydroxybutyryl-CoA dehydratase